jgi:hypothetical protein
MIYSRCTFWNYYSAFSPLHVYFLSTHDNNREVPVLGNPLHRTDPYYFISELGSCTCLQAHACEMGTRNLGQGQRRTRIQAYRIHTTLLRINQTLQILDSFTILMVESIAHSIVQVRVQSLEWISLDSGVRASPPVYPYLYEVKLLENEIDLLASDFHLLIQQEFICIWIGRAMCWGLLAFWLYNRESPLSLSLLGWIGMPLLKLKQVEIIHT